MVSPQPQKPLPILDTGNNAPFDVLGIALVVEEKRKGARLVFRYPATASAVPKSNNAESSSSSSSSDDLFFTLPPLVMAKLFRPKKPLCGQPMTISVGGTVFCCRAVLFDDDDTDDDDDETNNNTNRENNLVLFCIVVALSPSTTDSSVPISGWFDESSHQEDLSRNLSSADDSSQLGSDEGSGRFASASFRSVRRAHVSLARLCRVLEREERRCQYLSIQASRLRKIRTQFGLSDTSTSANSNQAPTGSSSSVANAPQTGSSDNVGRHRRLGSGSVVASIAGSIADVTQGGGDRPVSQKDAESVAILEQQELEQEALEAMLSAKSLAEEEIQPQSQQHRQHHGNLARELSQVFHILSRNTKSSVRTPSALLSGRDALVYINRHVAVPIEAIDGDSAALLSVPMNHLRGGNTTTDFAPVIRPYHTLLFPHASPSEFMERLPVSSSSLNSSQRLQQLLLMTNPRKTLAEIAVDAALPLPTALEVTGHLASHGTCIVSPVIVLSSRFACSHDAISRMRELALDFTNHFGPTLSIFMAVSALTADTLGKVMNRVSSPTLDDPNDTCHLLGERIAATLQQPCLPPGFLSDKGASRRGGYGDFSGPVDRDDQGVIPREHIEEVVYSLAIYLRSLLVIVEVKDYLVSISPKPKTFFSDASDTSAMSPGRDSIKESTAVDPRSPEEGLFDELLESGCLSGQISTTALCWRHGLDVRQLHRFKEWAIRKNRVLVVNRTPDPTTDDWGAA